jgi:hypothetical protein
MAAIYQYTKDAESEFSLRMGTHFDAARFLTGPQHDFQLIGYSPARL